MKDTKLPGIIKAQMALTALTLGTAAFAAYNAKDTIESYVSIVIPLSWASVFSFNAVLLWWDHKQKNKRA